MPKSSKTKVDYHHVTFEAKREYVTCRVPEWAAHVADSVVPGSKVTTCKTKDGKWHTSKVMVPVTVSLIEASRAANQIKKMLDGKKRRSSRKSNKNRRSSRKKK
jgi:hypothetical protein